MAMTKKTSIALAASVAMTAGLALSPMAAADSNPFQSTDLSNGYMQVAEHHGKEGKCGEAKCGGDMKDKEGKCGEAKCGAEMKDKEAACGGEMKDSEGKCGEGKCGS